MAPKRKPANSATQSKSSKTSKTSPSVEPAGGDVFVLTYKDVNHSTCHVPDTKVIGIFTSKEAAVAVAGSVDTPHGTFDEALKDFGYGEELSCIDNRKRPPDSGILLQFGSEEEGEGDYTQLLLEKFKLNEAAIGRSEPTRGLWRRNNGTTHY